jgi:Flp pilus assembly protein TadB
MSILLWLASPLGRLVAAGAAILVFLSAFALDQRSRGRQQVITASKQEAQKINAKNAPVFDRAERPGAAQRVLERYCRDCK